MKKYKLIKEYPGSPCFETEIIEAADIKGKYFIKRNSVWFINNPEKYPEFWELVIEYPINTEVFNRLTKNTYIKKEDGWYNTSNKTAYTDEMIIKSNYINIIKDEVVEKDYEILSFICKIDLNSLKKGIIVSKSKNNPFYFKSENNSIYDRESKFLKISHWDIHSIKRLSDGEVFTISDNTNKRNIIKFDLDNNKIVYKSGLCIYTNEFGYDLSEIQKIKQPLFVTEDGVDIFEGDEYYKVLNETFLLLIMKNASTGESLKSKVFSTKEKAEEYILLNKPCLSLLEIKKVLLSAGVGLSNKKEKELKDLVKSKNK